MPSFVTLLRAPNPGPMTLDGTNTWILRARPGLPAVVVDPGPADEGHLAAIVAAGPIGAIMVTHRHLDHVEGVARLRDLLAGHAASPAAGHPASPAAGHAATPAADHATTPAADHPATPAADHATTPAAGHAATPAAGHPVTGHPATPAAGHPATPAVDPARPDRAPRPRDGAAPTDPAPTDPSRGGPQEGDRVPVYAADPVHAAGTEPLRDGDRLALAGLDIEVVAAPGHTGDSVCLLVSDAAGERAVFTGDTILGRGTAVIAWPDGDLGDYLATLDRLSAYTRIKVFPGHGPELPDCGEIAREYRAHRDDRIVQVRGALAAGAQTPAEVVAHVYPDLEPALVPAAEWTVRAALAYLHPPSGNSP